MKNFQRLLALVFTSIFCLGSSEDLSAQSSAFDYAEYVSEKGDTLKYLQLMSDFDQRSKYPLVIFLHGSGERGDDNEAQLKWGVKNFASSKVMSLHQPIVIAPQCPKDATWGNYDYSTMKLKSLPTRPMELLIELIEDAISNLPVDTNRIYITGLSMGGFGTFDALSRHPDLFAAAVPVCGGGDPSLASTFAHIPMWIFHGADDDVVPVDWTDRMYVALRKNEAHPGLTIYPETGHFSWVAAYSDEKMMDWLFKQKK